MQTYAKFSPTSCDQRGLCPPDQQDWLVSLSRNRDSDCLTESNFHSALKSLGGESETVQVHRFGHWACGWFEVILVAPDSDAAKEAEQIEAALADYCVLDDSDFSERENEAANSVWESCYSNAKRIEYIRDNRSQFEFHNLADMMSCVRGKHFAGYASELLG